MSLGRRFHHVRFAAHRTRFPLVSLHNSELPSLLEVSQSIASNYTKTIMITFHSGDTASCLHNAPHEDDALGRALPGTLLSLDAQCRRDRGTSACFKDERVCAQLFCFDAASGYCVAYRPAAEGSPCGDGSVKAQKILNYYVNCTPSVLIGHYYVSALSRWPMCCRTRKHHSGLFAAYAKLC